MSSILAVLKKELKVAAFNPQYYIITAFLMLAVGLISAATYFISNTANLNLFAQVFSILSAIYTPAVTMKMIADEKKSGTYELMATSQLSDTKFLLGKYIAGYIIVAFTVFVSIYYIVVVSISGEPDWGAMISAYIGILFVNIMYIAIGIFASSVTTHQALAYVIAFLINIMIMLLSVVSSFLPSSFGAALLYLSSYPHYANFGRGFISLGDIIYFISVAALFLHMAKYGMFIEKPNNNRKFVEHMHMLSVVVIFIFINMIASNIVYNIDLTAKREYTLSKASKDLMKQLDADVTMVMLVSSQLPAAYSQYTEYVSYIANEYQKYSGGKFRLRIISSQDLAVMRKAALDYGIQQISTTTIGSGSFQTKEIFMGAELTYKGKTTVFNNLSQIQNPEFAITNTLKSYLIKHKKKVAILANRGFFSSKQGASILSSTIKQTYDVEDIVIDPKKGIKQLKDFEALIVVGGFEPLDTKSRNIVEQFVISGKPTILAVANQVGDMNRGSITSIPSPFNPFFAKNGITVSDSVVIDRNGFIISTRTKKGNPITVSYPFFPMVEKIDTKRELNSIKALAFVFPSYIMFDNKSSLHMTPLIQSSAESGIAPNGTPISPELNVDNVLFDSGEKDLAVNITGTFVAENGLKGKGNIYIIASPVMFLDNFIGSGDNFKLLPNIVNTTMGDLELMDIRNKSISIYPITIHNPLEIAILKASMVIVPILIVIICAAIAFVYNKKRKLKKFN